VNGGKVNDVNHSGVSLSTPAQQKLKRRLLSALRDWRGELESEVECGPWDLHLSTLLDAIVFLEDELEADIAPIQPEPVGVILKDVLREVLA